MTIWTGFALFVVMLTLAALPSASVALVVTRSATLGFNNGIAAIAGIVAGDVLLVTLALMGMSVLAQTMGIFFTLIKYIAGGYLIWFGLQLLRAKSLLELQPVESRQSTLLASFVSGLLLTLGDVKAVFFYASLLPTVVNLANLNGWDVVGIIGVTIVTVGGVKLVYALATQKIVRWWQKRPTSRGLQIAAGSLMVGAGTYLIVKT